jgi:hypothetical protein
MTTTPPPSRATAPVKKTPPAGPIARALARVYLWFFGWKIEARCRRRSAPSRSPTRTRPTGTCPSALAIAYRLGIRPSWLASASLPKPFGFMRWLGGTRSTAARTNMVTQVVERRRDHRLFLVIRRRTRHKGHTGSLPHRPWGRRADPLPFLDYKRAAASGRPSCQW